MKAGRDHPIARELRAARAYADMSRIQIGNLIGMSDETIGQWERGNFTREPKAPMLRAIADGTNFPSAFQHVIATPPTSRVDE